MIHTSCGCYQFRLAAESFEEKKAGLLASA
jgi:hypothetical protein